MSVDITVDSQMPNFELTNYSFRQYVAMSIKLYSDRAYTQFNSSPEMNEL